MNNRLEIPKLENIESTVSKIKTGEVSVLELVKEHIELAKKVNPQINAFISILEDSAMQQATALAELIKKNDPAIKNKKLLGIPFTVKDLYLVKDTKTTFGSQYMKNFVAPYTSTVVQKCLDEGAILIAKCNCDPWGFGGSGENSGFGPTKNPYDFARTPGGSSSGSGASLAAGVGFFSLGTDTGGSVRAPAALCGLYGLKPTYGRNSRYGIGSMGSSFDTPGFLARHVADIALVESIIEGKDINDATSQTLPKAASNLQPPTSNLVVGIPKEYFVEGLSHEVKVAINEKIEEIKELGFEVKEVSLPSTKYALPAYYVLVPSEISSNRAKYDGVRFGPEVSTNYEENMVQGRSQFLEEEVKRRIMIGTYSLSAGYGDQFYKKASNVRTKLKREFTKVFEEVDVLIAPVMPTTAFKLGENIADPVQMYLLDVFTVTANLVGIPSLAIPLGLDSNELPIGMQVMGRKFEDNLLFKFAEEIK